MAQATRTEVLNCTKEQLKKAIVDYESYPEFVEGLESATIVEDEGDIKCVRFSLNLIKRFNYVVKLTEEDTRVHWTLLEGDIFKKNEGSWDLTPQGESKVEATYTLELDFKVFVPKMVTKKLAGSNLPTMMQQFEKRAQRY